MRRPAAYILLAGSALLVMTVPVFAAEVSFSVSNRETYVGVPIQVQVSIQNAQSHDPPEFPEIPNADVRAMGSSNQSFMKITPNGRQEKSMTTVYNYQVIPKKPGILKIPVITVAADGATTQSAPADVVVKKSETGDLLFLEIIGQSATVYVGEPIDVSLEIWVKVFATGRVQMGAEDMWRTIDQRSSSWGPFIENLQSRSPEVTYRSDRRRGASGTENSYYVYSLRRTVWPERAGVFTADGVSVLVNYPLQVRQNPFSLIGPKYEVAESRPVTAVVEDSKIVINSPPAEGQPASYRGAVGKYTFDVSASPTEVSVGDPITLAMAIRGSGKLETLQAPALTRQESLTADFRVPEEELAGVVEGGVKKFTQSIRAKNDQVTQVPPIEFGYFDPKAERYVTLRSEPVPIKVTQSSRLSVSQVVESGVAAETRTQLTMVETGLLANIDDLDALLLQETMTVGWETWAVVGSGPMVYAVGLIVCRRRTKLACDRGFARRRTAKRSAMAAISQASGDLISAVTGYVADRCDLPGGSMTGADAVQALRERGIPEEIVREVGAFLAECEAGQYGGGASGASSGLVDRATRVIEELESRKF